MRHLMAVLAAGLLAVGVTVVVVDFAAAAIVFGPEYVRRLVLWRHPGPLDQHRFPSRAIAASPNPLHYESLLGGEEIVRRAFVSSARAELRTGETMEQMLARTGTTSFLVLRHDQLLYEHYFNGHARDSMENSFSIAKTVTALLVGTAISDGLLPSVDTPIEQLLPDVAALKGQGVTLRDLLTMTAGYDIDNRRPFGLLSVPWSTNQRVNFATDLRAVATSVRVAFTPGTRFQYDDRTPMLVGMALERATGGHLASYLGRRLWQPMGAEYPAAWSLDSEAHGFEKMETGLSARAVDFLKLGDLMLRRGVRPDGTHILPSTWIDAMTAPPARPAVGFTPNFTEPQARAREFYGFFCWGIESPETGVDFYGNGIFGQVLYVSRSSDTVILRTGDREGGPFSWPELIHDLAAALT